MDSNKTLVKTLKHILNEQQENKDGWIGFDLDGTLCEYQSGYVEQDKIGEPIVPILNILKRFLDQGKNIKIFTARVAQDKNAKDKIQNWLEKNGLPRLDVTNIKDHHMIELWDDRAVQVETNTGKILGRSKIE